MATIPSQPDRRPQQTGRPLQNQPPRPTHRPYTPTPPPGALDGVDTYTPTSQPDRSMTNEVDPYQGTGRQQFVRLSSPTTGAQVLGAQTFPTDNNPGQIGVQVTAGGEGPNGRLQGSAYAQRNGRRNQQGVVVEAAAGGPGWQVYAGGALRFDGGQPRRVEGQVGGRIQNDRRYIEGQLNYSQQGPRQSVGARLTYGDGPNSAYIMAQVERAHREQTVILGAGVSGQLDSETGSRYDVSVTRRQDNRRSSTEVRGQVSWEINPPRPLSEDTLYRAPRDP